MEYTNFTFRDQEVRLAGHVFVRCTFQDCRIIFTAAEPTELIDCNIGTGCSWDFDGPAEDTVVFLALLYHAGPGTRAVVENTFESIRRGDMLHPRERSSRRDN